jgi:putative alpha-1,2-mannosidase
MNTDKNRFGLWFSVFGLWFLLLTAYCSVLTAQSRDYTRWVNPFIGTGGHGHTFPGAVMPFGMVQLSPDTRIDNWDGSSGYHYSDDIIYGFSHTHLSGTGIPDGCDILFMPTIGNNNVFGVLHEARNPNGYVERFSHDNENAEPGYYSLKIDRTNILAELTATKRVGFHRYSFPQAGQANVVLDLGWRDKVTESQLKVMSKNRVEGFRRSKSWAKNQTVYFVAEFSKPIIDQSANNPSDIPLKDFGISHNYGFMVAKNEPILVKVAISYVSIAGARRNMQAELPHWDFDKVRREAKTAWNRELSKIEVSGGTDDQMTNFYTALYHTMIHPSVFNDVDGRYRGMDGKIHKIGASLRKPAREQGRNTQHSDIALAYARASATSEQYSVFSLWDTFRAAHPLYTIIDQRRTVDFINSFIRIYEQGGRLPVWELWGEETDTMIGYHAVSVIADAMAKGIKGFDYEKAYAAAKHSAELDHFGLAAYKKRGYISMEDENESVSRTLEYAYNDWCIAQMADILFKRKLAEIAEIRRKVAPDPISDSMAIPFLKDRENFKTRARYFENLFDPKTGFFRAKKNGGFVEPFAPNEVTFGFTEGNSWQYSFFVPHDVTRLIELMGGPKKFGQKLDELFSTKDKLAGREQADLTGLIGQYAHGNEPSHHIAYLYNYAGEPWKTQQMVRRIMDEYYKPTPDGLIGNEDCGQMSAWYVMSALGLYQVAPGEPDYAIGTPLFTQAKIKLENGRAFFIQREKAWDFDRSGVLANRRFIESVTLDNQKLAAPTLTHAALVAGGEMKFYMSNMPVKNAFTEFPYKEPKKNFVAVPLIDGERVIKDKTTITLSTTAAGAKIYYTTDGSEPTDKSLAYTAPFNINTASTIKAMAINAFGEKSLVAEGKFHKKPNDWTVTIASKYSTQYTGGGDEGLIDGIRGTTNFASGEWQGYQGKPFEAVIDLQRASEVKNVGGSFLQVAGPWIWMPTKIEFETSTDGASFTRVAEIVPNFPQREMTPTIKEFRQTIAPTMARYVRVRASNFGKIPSWHAGAGGDPWIFVDEIFID